MFGQRFVETSPVENLETPVGTYFAEFPDFEAQTMPPVSERFECVYEPIYKRFGHRFIPAGHKASVRLKQNTNEFGREAVAGDTTLTMFRAMEQGATQREVLSCQLESFASQFQEHDRMAMEIDIFDLETDQTGLTALTRLIEDAKQLGIPADRFILELSASPLIDVGVLYAISEKLKATGARVALINVDIDAFSMSRIFQIEPFAVKFNRSWRSVARLDKRLVDMTRSLVEQIQSDGKFCCFTGVETEADLEFVKTCKFTRCQGSFFGEPSTTMTRGAVYTV